MLRSMGLTVLLCVAVLPAAGATAQSKRPRPPPLMPPPRVGIVKALSIARADVSGHGALVGVGYISRVEYGRFRKMSSGARCTCARPQTPVWAITYTDMTRASSKARQIIDATSGKVLTRVYFAP